MERPKTWGGTYVRSDHFRVGTGGDFGTLTPNPIPMKRILSLLAVLAATFGVRAADAPGLVNGNPPDIHTLKSGDAAPDFTLIGTDGKMHKLAEYTGGEALVVLFLLDWYSLYNLSTRVSGQPAACPAPEHFSLFRQFPHLLKVQKKLQKTALSRRTTPQTPE